MPLLRVGPTPNAEKDLEVSFLQLKEVQLEPDQRASSPTFRLEVRPACLRFPYNYGVTKHGHISAHDNGLFGVAPTLFPTSFQESPG